MPIFHKIIYGYPRDRTERVQTHSGERPRWLISKYYIAGIIDAIIFFGSFMQYEGRYSENVLEQLIFYRENFWKEKFHAKSKVQG